MHSLRLIPCLNILSLQPWQLCVGQVNSKETAGIEKFATTLSRDLQRDNMHGCVSVLILKNDRLIFEKEMRSKRAAVDLAADSATIYCIASVTKTFIATLLLQLVEQGKIKLGDPVDNYIPEIKSLVGYTANTVITFRQLASHTAGLTREPDYRNSMSGPAEEWENILLACIPHTSIENPPGKVYQYSNIGFALLGLALERVAHTPYIQLVKQKILTPLIMDESFFLFRNPNRVTWLMEY